MFQQSSDQSKCCSTLTGCRDRDDCGAVHRVTRSCCLQVVLQLFLSDCCLLFFFLSLVWERFLTHRVAHLSKCVVKFPDAYYQTDCTDRDGKSFYYTAVAFPPRALFNVVPDDFRELLHDCYLSHEIIPTPVAIFLFFSQDSLQCTKSSDIVCKFLSGYFHWKYLN